MKKISWILIVAFMLTLIIPSFAFSAYDQDLQKAIETAKAKLAITQNFDTFNYSISKNEDKSIFYLNWSDSHQVLGNINVTIDSNGRITEYNYYKPYNETNRKKLPALSRSEAKTKAEAFIQNLDPALLANLRLEEGTSPITSLDSDYFFNYLRIENGIPYPDNTVYVTVSASTGEVVSYYRNWFDNVSFIDPKGAIPLADAQKLQQEKLGLKLLYRLNYPADNNPAVPYLVYSMVYNNQYIDAITGEVVTSQMWWGYGGYGGNGKGEGGAGAADLTPQEQEAIKSAADIMDEKTAEATARDALNISDNLNLNYISLYQDWQTKNDFYWSMDFSRTGQEESGILQSISVSLNAKTGEITSFWRYIPSDGSKKAIYGRDAAQRIAKNFIESMQPEKAGQTELTEWNPYIQPLASGELPREQYFNFTRKANGAYFENNGFNLTVDAVSGTVTGYNMSWYKNELPATDQVISSDKAHEILFDQIGLQLQYVSVIPDGYTDNFFSSNTKKETKLVYALKTNKPSNIDALTGNILDYSGKPYVQPQVSQYTDIAGSFAEKQINILAQYGISLPGTEYKPNQTITQKEFLYLLFRVTNPYQEINLTSPTDEDILYSNLLALGIIKEGERNPKATLTRQDGVKFIIRTMKEEKVATIEKNIFTVPFKDADQISKGYLGYFAIAYGMNIVVGYENKIEPNANMNRAQAAAMIYNMLNVM